MLSPGQLIGDDLVVVRILRALPDRLYVLATDARRPSRSRTCWPCGISVSPADSACPRCGARGFDQALLVCVRSVADWTPAHDRLRAMLSGRKDVVLSPAMREVGDWAVSVLPRSAGRLLLHTSAPLEDVVLERAARSGAEVGWRDLHVAPLQAHHFLVRPDRTLALFDPDPAKHPVPHEQAQHALSETLARYRAPTRRHARPLLDVAAISDQGCVRDENQDTFGWAEVGEATTFLAVADGMGGHADGAVAAKLALECALQIVRNEFDERPRGAIDQEQLLLRAMTAAHEAVRARGGGGRRSMGSTLVVALVDDDGRAVIAHIGDSRAYVVSRNRTVRLTNDHSVVSRLLSRGEVSQEVARNHPLGHILTSAIGTCDHTPVPDLCRTVLGPGERLLLCTDGLWGLVEDDLYRQAWGPLVGRHVERLVGLALSAGARDNVTALLAEMRAEP